jgi:DNA-binding CsgD family transcriptional regulator
MRHWIAPAAPEAALLTGLVHALGLPVFRSELLERVRSVVPASSCSVYRLGRQPRLFLSGATGVPDTTRDCWRAYLSGPHRRDRSLVPAGPAAAGGQPVVCHITASDVPAEHRARVYEAHGVAERLSVVQQVDDGTVFAVNFYRHAQARAYSDRQLADFGAVAAPVLALVRKHVALAGVAGLGEGGNEGDGGDDGLHRRQLLALCPALTAREIDVCERLLGGMTYEGVAVDLGLSVPTVKTYRNRAFARLGIHFRSELTALLLRPRPLNG